MRFHPVISILLGVIAWFVLFIIAILCGVDAGWIGAFIFTGPSFFGTFLLIASYILGGFIATYFAKEMKIKYGILIGIIIILMINLLPIAGSSFIIFDVIPISIIFLSFILLIFSTCLGGMLAQMTEEKYNGFNPILAVIAGVTIAFFLNGLISLLNPNYIPPLSLINIIIVVVSLIIGAFLTTFLAKERKIQYGIYTGIIVIVISLIECFTLNIPIYYGLIVVYLLTALVGGYLAIKITEHQQNLNKESL